MNTQQFFLNLKVIINNKKTSVNTDGEHKQNFLHVAYKAHSSNVFLCICKFSLFWSVYMTGYLFIIIALADWLRRFKLAILFYDCFLRSCRQ